ncbi:MAG: hypothetical protein GX560_04405 [Deinococcales bacterium]|nr:hypothetical protein [Deinococcales bacterium]
MSRSRTLLGVVVTLLSSLALAEGAWFETGTLTAVIDGEERLLRTFGTLVAADVADGVEDAQQRALLERVAGTEQHTATHKLVEGMTLGGIVLTPPTLWVVLTFHHDASGAAGPHDVTLQFPLDPTTLELSDPDQVEIKYFPNGSSYDDFYALTDGALSLTAVEVVDDVTLRVRGAFAGVLTHQTSFDLVHDPDTAIAVEAGFVVERVVGSQLVLETLQGAD